jgi:uncharacterized protein (DUF58 family)
MVVVPCSSSLGISFFVMLWVLMLWVLMLWILMLWVLMLWNTVRAAWIPAAEVGFGGGPR